MQYQIETKTVEEYLIAFPIKMEEVDKVIGRPTFTKINKVIVAIKRNCIAMDDTRSRVGKLHCIMNSQHLETGGIGIPPSVNPGPATFAGLASAAARDNYIIDHTAQMAQWQADCNVKEACKRFLVSRFEPVYFQELADPVTDFKQVSVRDMLRHLTTRYPPTPDETQLQEAILQEDWDPNNHIENLFQSVREGVETLLAMGAITVVDLDKTYIKYVYYAIRGSGQFDAACIKWNLLPAIDRQTIAQIRAYFTKKYDIFDASQNSLHQAGVANSVQLQEILQATNDGLISVRDIIRDNKEEVDTFKSTILQMVKAKNNDTVDDTATTFSAMTAHSALQEQNHQRRMAELEALIRSNNSGGGGGRDGGGRGGGRGRGNQTYRRWSDGPANATKTSKYYPNDNYCWKHGYDCSNKHHSGTCRDTVPGHQAAATGANPMGGSMKDKEFSKWKD